MGKEIFRNHDVVILTIAVYLGVVLTDFFKAVSRDVLSPFVSTFVEKDRIEDYSFQLWGSTYKLGHLFVQFLNVIVAVILVLITVKLIRRYANGWIKHLYA